MRGHRMLGRRFVNRVPLTGRRAVMRVSVRLPAICSDMRIRHVAGMRAMRMCIGMRALDGAIRRIVLSAICGLGARDVRLLLSAQLVVPDCFETRRLLARAVVCRRRTTAVRHDRVQVVATVEDLLPAIPVCIEVPMTMSVRSRHPDIGASAHEHDIAIKRGRDIDVVRLSDDLLLNRGPYDHRWRRCRLRGDDDRRSRGRRRRLTDDAWRCAHATREHDCARDTCD